MAFRFGDCENPNRSPTIYDGWCLGQRASYPKMKPWLGKTYVPQTTVLTTFSESYEQQKHPYVQGTKHPKIAKLMRVFVEWRVIETSNFCGRLKTIQMYLPSNSEISQILAILKNDATYLFKPETHVQKPNYFWHLKTIYLKFPGKMCFFRWRGAIPFTSPWQKGHWTQTPVYTNPSKNWGPTVGITTAAVCSIPRLVVRPARNCRLGASNYAEEVIFHPNHSLTIWRLMHTFYHHNFGVNPTYSHVHSTPIHSMYGPYNITFSWAV